MINEANGSSSACNRWRIHPVETSAPPSIAEENLGQVGSWVKTGFLLVLLNSDLPEGLGRGD